MDGLVCAQGSETLLVEAHEQWVSEQARKAAEAHTHKMAAKWSSLTRKVLTRQRLQTEYGKF